MFSNLTILFSFLSLLFLVRAAPTPELSSLSTDYEVIVVGGGPSGLAALSSLGRIRRTALLIDSAQYRNAPTRLMHDVAGFDGVTPAYYRWSAMQQIAHYPTVNATNGTVTNIKPESNYTFFTVSMTAFDGSSSKLTARKIILATGLRDILPETPGLKEGFGKGIYWCPYCDGIEHADQSMGILGPLDEAIEAAAEVTTLNSDIVIFANGTDIPKYWSKANKKLAKPFEYLQTRNIKVDNRTITRFTRLQNGDAHVRDPSLPTVPEHDLFRVEFDDFGRVERGVFFTAFPSEQRSTLGRDLGVKLVDGKMDIPDRRNMRTNIPGIYAVGDASTDKSTNVLHALYTGKIAVVDIQMELEKEISRSLKPYSQVAEGDETNPETLLVQINDTSDEVANDL